MEALYGGFSGLLEAKSKTQNDGGYMFDWLVDSFGLKRRITALLAVLVELARSDPKYNSYISIVEQIAGWLGITSLVHAGAKGTLKQFKALTWGAAFTGLIALAHYVPQLTPFVPFLYKLSAFLSALGIGISVQKPKKK